MSHGWLLCGEEAPPAPAAKPKKGGGAAAEGGGGGGARGARGGRALLWSIGDVLTAADAGAEPTSTMSEHTAGVTSVALSEHLCASAGSSDQTARVWRLQQTGRAKSLAALSHAGAVTSVATNWAGTLLVAGCADGCVYVWSLTSFTTVATLEHAAGGGDGGGGVGGGDGGGGGGGGAGRGRRRTDARAGCRGGCSGR